MWHLKALKSQMPGVHLFERIWAFFSLAGWRKYNYKACLWVYLSKHKSNSFSTVLSFPYTPFSLGKEYLMLLWSNKVWDLVVPKYRYFYTDWVICDTPPQVNSFLLFRMRSALFKIQVCTHGQSLRRGWIALTISQQCLLLQPSLSHSSISN